MIETKPVVLFDMDGVILDSAAAITASLAFALNSINVKSTEYNDLTVLVGPPLHRMIELLIPDATASEKEAFTNHYRSHNNEHGPALTPVFDGMEDLLLDLSKKFALVITTSKLESAAQQIINEKGLSSMFTCVLGTRPGTTDSKIDVVSRAIEMTRNVPIMGLIGDRVHDINAAEFHQNTSIAVTWGYASKGEIERSKPNYVVRTPAELRDLIDRLSPTP